MIFVIVEGGMVEHIVADSDVDVVVLDKDVPPGDGVDDIGGNPTCVIYPCVTVDPDTVSEWQQQINK